MTPKEMQSIVIQAINEMDNIFEVFIITPEPVELSTLTYQKDLYITLRTENNRFNFFYDGKLNFVGFN